MFIFALQWKQVPTHPLVPWLSWNRRKDLTRFHFNVGGLFFPWGQLRNWKVVSRPHPRCFKRDTHARYKLTIVTVYHIYCNMYYYVISKHLPVCTSMTTVPPAEKAQSSVLSPTLCSGPVFCRGPECRDAPRRAHIASTSGAHFLCQSTSTTSPGVASCALCCRLT